MMICVAGIAGAMGRVAGAAAGNSSVAHLLGRATLLNLTTFAFVSCPICFQTAAQGLLDYALTLTEGEELMFTLDVPYVPAQDTPIVLALAATPAAGAAPQPDYILKDCTQTEHTTDPRSALRGVDPVGSLRAYIGNRDHRVIDAATTATIKPTLLEGTSHGKLNRQVAPNGEVYFMYDPEPEYLGDDRAVFMAEFEGKVYKIVVDIKVLYIVDDNSNQCPPAQLIKVNGKPVSGSTGYGSDYRLGSLSVTFADLGGGAVGQTVGTNITLDDNAAGHNWFIDATPADNSEYLPTSNPNEWVAKEGTDAYGKMDMLSVLLHEYGHALGIDHSTKKKGTTKKSGSGLAK